MGTTIWSPLMFGVLTGKYNNGIPKGSRMTQKGYEWLKERLKQQKADGTLDKVEKLTAFAEELDCSMTQLALAWCVKNPNVSTVLLGATRLRQIEENLGALGCHPVLNEERMNCINGVLGNAPASYQGFGGSGT